MTLSIITCEDFVRPFSGAGSIRTRSLESTRCEVSRHTVTEGGSELYLSA